jgi:tetratricopeptide (TPR) repeat protein
VSTEPNRAGATAGPLERVEALLAVGRHAEAIPWLERAIADDPTALEPRCRLALAFLRLKQHPQALRAAERAVAAVPTHEWPHRIRALVLLRLKRKRDALAAAHEAVRLAPEVPEVHVISAEALLANGDKRAALASAERAVSLAPERSLTHEMLGEVLLELRNLARAEEHFRRALALDPESFEAMNNLGVVLQRQGREQEAMEQFHRAARLDPTSQLAQKNLANSIDRHVDPCPDVPRAAQVGLIVLGILLPPVRLLMLAWWLGSIVIRRARVRELPPSLLMAYRLQRRSRFSWTVALFCLGLVGVMVFLTAGLSNMHKGVDAALVSLFALAVLFLILAVVTGVQLWHRARSTRG